MVRLLATPIIISLLWRQDSLDLPMMHASSRRMCYAGPQGWMHKQTALWRQWLPTETLADDKIMAQRTEQEH